MLRKLYLKNTGKLSRELVVVAKVLYYLRVVAQRAIALDRFEPVEISFESHTN